MHETSLISYYESVACVTAQMREAARRSDWDALMKSEQLCGEIIAEIRIRSQTHALTEADQNRKAQLIRQMLADDADIRNYLDPWLRKLEGWLQVDTLSKKVDRLYLPRNG